MNPKLKERLTDIAIVISILLFALLVFHRCSAVVDYYNDPNLNQHISPNATNEMRGTP